MSFSAIIQPCFVADGYYSIVTAILSFTDVRRRGKPGFNRIVCVVLFAGIIEPLFSSLYFIAPDSQHFSKASKLFVLTKNVKYFFSIKEIYVHSFKGQIIKISFNKI